MAIDSPTADMVAVVDRTPIALSVPAKAMMMGGRSAGPVARRSWLSVLIASRLAVSSRHDAPLTLRSRKEQRIGATVPVFARRQRSLSGGDDSCRPGDRTSIAGVVPRIEGSHKGSLEGCRSFLFIARALIHTCRCSVATSVKLDPADGNRQSASTCAGGTTK